MYRLPLDGTDLLLIITVTLLLLLLLQSVKLTTHVHLLPRLRMRGAIPPPPDVLMVWSLIKGAILS
jgi:hypothetical protein